MNSRWIRGWRQGTELGTRGAIARRTGQMLALTLCAAVLGSCGGGNHSAPAPTATPASTATSASTPTAAPTATATDPEGQPVTLMASGYPQNSYFLPASGIFCIFADDPSQLDTPLHITF